MNTNPVKQRSMKTEAMVLIVDLEELTESVWRDLHGTEDPAQIRHVLVELLLKYKDARILTFLPILLRRDAIEALRH
jgi:hypothetical protein